MGIIRKEDVHSSFNDYIKEVVDYDSTITSLNDFAKYNYFGISANQSIASDIATTIVFNTSTGNGDCVLNNGNIKINTNGIYLIIYSLSFSNNTTGYRQLALKKLSNQGVACDVNLSVERRDADTAFDTVFEGVSYFGEFKPNDVIGIIARQSSGTSLNITDCQIKIKKVG